MVSWDIPSNGKWCLDTIGLLVNKKGAWVAIIHNYKGIQTNTPLTIWTFSSYGRDFAIDLLSTMSREGSSNPPRSCYMCHWKLISPDKLKLLLSHQDFEMT